MDGTHRALDLLGTVISQLEQQLTQKDQVIATQQSQIEDLKKATLAPDVQPSP